MEEINLKHTWTNIYKNITRKEKETDTASNINYQWLSWVIIHRTPINLEWICLHKSNKDGTFITFGTLKGGGLLQINDGLLQIKALNP